MRERLTATKIAALKPTGKRQYIWCGEMPGFGVRSSEGTSKTFRRVFVLRYRSLERRDREHTIGRCDVLTVEQARREAKDLLGRVARGEDPAATKQATREAPTVQDLYERWQREHAPKRKHGTTRKQEHQWQTYILPRWGRRQVVSITDNDVSRLMGDLADKPGAANRTFALISKAMNLAETWKMRPKFSNPCRGVDRYPEKKEHGTPLDSELAGRLYAAAELRPHNRASAITRLALLTGCRNSELNAAERAWIVRRADGWGSLNLPDSKGGAVVKDLVPEAMAIIDALPALIGSPYLFPNHRRPKPGQRPRPRGFPYRDWRLLLQAAGVPPIRFHDLRHTFGTLADGEGATQRQIASALSHKQLSTTARYTHAREAARRSTVARTAGAILKAAGKPA